MPFFTSEFFGTPVLSRRRIGLAVAVAILADGLQLLMGPFGWAFADQAIDLVAMLLLTFSIGFHPLFLPTFLIELFPGIDMLPTWTGCVVFVLALRRKQPPTKPVPPAIPPEDVIDV